MSKNIVFPDVTGYLLGGNKEFTVQDGSNVNYLDKSLLRVRGVETIKKEFSEAFSFLDELFFVANEFRAHANALINKFDTNPFRVDIRKIDIRSLAYLNNGVSPEYPKFFWFLRNGRKLVQFQDLWSELIALGFGSEDLWVYMAIERQIIEIEKRIMQDKYKIVQLGHELMTVMGLPKTPFVPNWIDVI